MAPIDDELRSVLSGRADQLAPVADPFAGIERRAQRIKRNRGFAAIVGTAAAVAVIAVAVPGLVGFTSPDRSGPPASGGPSEREDSALLQLDRPWGFRGAFPDTFFRAVQAGWQAKHPDSQMTLLFGQGYEPAGTQEAAFIARGPDGDYYGWVAVNGDGTRFLVESDYPQPQSALAFALPGDEVARVVVVAAPDSKVTSTTRLTELAPGVVIAPLESAVAYTVTDRSGHVLQTGRVTPDAVNDLTPPGNAVGWPMRGSLADGPDIDAAKRAFAAGLGGKVADLQFQPLLSLSTDGGLRYLAGQAWLTGGKAHAVAYATGGECGAEPFIGRETPAGAKVLAFAPGCVPGRSTDTVFVVPAPETGQVSYGAGASEFRPLEPLPGLEPVVELERLSPTDRGDDQLQVLDGDGDLGKPLYEGPLTTLLCGIKSCG